MESGCHTMGRCVSITHRGGTTHLDRPPPPSKLQRNHHVQILLLKKIIIIINFFFFYERLKIYFFLFFPQTVFFLVLLPPSKIKVLTPAHAPVEWLVRGRLVVDWGVGAGRAM